jgi:hypothetical protein
MRLEPLELSVRAVGLCASLNFHGNQLHEAKFASDAL